MLFGFNLERLHDIKRKPMEHPLSNPRGLQFRAKRKKNSSGQGDTILKRASFSNETDMKREVFPNKK